MLGALNRPRTTYAVCLALAAAALLAYHFPYLLRGGEPRPHSRQLLGLCFLAIATRPFLAETEFRRLLLALSVIGCAVWAQLDCAGIFCFAALVIAISRSKLAMPWRIVAVALLWLAPIVSKLWLEPALIKAHWPLFVYWAGIPFSALYLIVERERGLLSQATWFDDALYLLALPRVVTPFFQAIPASSFFRSQQSPASDVKLVLRGASLLLYGVVLFVLMAKFPYIRPPGPDALPDPRASAQLPGLHNLLFIYGINASAIFCAVGLFRLLGFDLSSGFRWPLLSTSFAEFYRRWNHYVYDTVKSLFLFPLMGRLRTVLPDALAGVFAGYLAIFLGSYCFSLVLVPLARDPNPRQVLEFALNPYQLLFAAVFWSLILLPQLLPHRASTATTTQATRLAKRAVFVGLLWLIANAARSLGVILL